MKCLLLVTSDAAPINDAESLISFESRNAALEHARLMAASGEQFTFELYEKVLEGGTSVKLDTRPATEKPTEIRDAVV